jgi:hypothetical protein
MARRYGDLAGMSLDVEVSCNGGRFRENLLFTHRGLSGPAILQISSYWDGKSPLSIDLLAWAGGRRWFRDQRTSTRAIDNVLAQRLPRRFVDAWCASTARRVRRAGSTIGGSLRSNPLFTIGAFGREGRLDTTRRSDASAVSTRAGFRRKRWARRESRDSTSSARSSM